nr:unnamed protein product [Callosobruchus analis]
MNQVLLKKYIIKLF